MPPSLWAEENEKQDERGQVRGDTVIQDEDGESNVVGWSQLPEPGSENPGGHFPGEGQPSGRGGNRPHGRAERRPGIFSSVAPGQNHLPSAF